MFAQAKDLVAILIGIVIYSLGFCMFVLPHGVVVGGMAGFSTLVYYATGGLVPVAVAMYGGNLLLLASGMRMLGKGFVARTIFGATGISLCIGCLEGYFTSHPPLLSSVPMSVALGAMMMGLGIGIYYSHHGTTGGTDIVAAIMAKKTTMSMGRVMMIVDISIVACSFFLPFDGDMQMRLQARTETIIYGWMAIFIYSQLADRYLQAGQQTVQLLVISDKWNEIAYRITHETGRGVTFWESRGYWTRDTREIMMVWCRKPNLRSMMQIIQEVDSHAYITISYVRGVYGNGFDPLRVKHAKQRKPKAGQQIEEQPTPTQA